MKKIIMVLVLSLVFCVQTKGSADEHKHNNMQMGKTMQTTGKITQETSKIKYVVCPVTKIKLDAAKAYSKTKYKGKTYYFCCEDCSIQFKNNPEKYIDKKVK